MTIAVTNVQLGNRRNCYSIKQTACNTYYVPQNKQTQYIDVGKHLQILLQKAALTNVHRLMGTVLRVKVNTTGLHIFIENRGGLLLQLSEKIVCTMGGSYKNVASM